VEAAPGLNDWLGRIMRDGFESHQKSDDGAYDGKEKVQPKGKPIPDWLAIALVYAHLDAPSASHDFLTGVTFKQQPDEYRTDREKDNCNHCVLRVLPDAA